MSLALYVLSLWFTSIQMADMLDFAKMALSTSGPIVVLLEESKPNRFPLLPLEHPWIYQWIFILDGLIFSFYLLTYLVTVFPYKLAHLAEYRYIN